MITLEMLRSIPIFAGLDDASLIAVAEPAADVEALPGEYLIHEGETPRFFVLLSGKLELTKRVGGIERVLGTRLPGDFFGEIPIVLGTAAFANLRAVEPSRLARVEPARFHELMARVPAIAASVLQTMSERLGAIQQMALEQPAAVTIIVGKRYDAACHDVRDFLAGNRVPFEWLDPDEAGALARVPEIADFPGRCPIVKFADGRVLVEPTKRAVAHALGLSVMPEHTEYDVVIVGGGPAGLAAAVYGSSEGLRTLLIEREAPGGQAGTSSRIENYLGFPAGVSGDDLADRALQQAKRLGAEMIVTRHVAAIHPGSPAHRIVLDGGDALFTRSIVLATGVTWRNLAADGADDLIGRGIFYGAARTEAQTVRGRDVFLIGAGNSAGQAAMFFANYARRVTLLVRGWNLEKSMSQYLIDQLHTKKNVAYDFGTELIAVQGSDRLQRIVTADRKTGAERTRDADALFVFIGAEAQTGWMPDGLLRDDAGYVITGSAARTAGWSAARDPYLLETSVPGVFAAGDVRHDSIKRVAAGVGEGSMAIAFIHQYLASLPAREPIAAG